MHSATVLSHLPAVDRRVKQVGFIEVKSGRSHLSSAQRSIREAVEQHRVFTEIWTVGDPNIPITQQFSNRNKAKLSE